jgi:hypothetical protein
MKRDKKVSETETSYSFITTGQESSQRVRSKTSDEALHLVMSRELLSEVFLGALKERSVRKFLKPNEFRLYYKVSFCAFILLHTFPCLDAEIEQQGRIEFASPNWIYEQRRQGKSKFSGFNLIVYRFITFQLLVRIRALRSKLGTLPPVSVNS